MSSTGEIASSSSSMFSLAMTRLEAYSRAPDHDAACTVFKRPGSGLMSQENCGSSHGCMDDDVASQQHKGICKLFYNSRGGSPLTESASSTPHSPRSIHSKTAEVSQQHVCTNPAVLPSISSRSNDAVQLDDADHRVGEALQQKEPSVAASVTSQNVPQPMSTTKVVLNQNNVAAVAAEGGASLVEGNANLGQSTAGAAAAEENCALPAPPNDTQQEGCSVFFARVPPTVPYESILALFQQFGHVNSLNLFRPWASAKTSKGCGIVEFQEPQAALAAMTALHTKYHWTGGETTMVVEWMDAARHRKDRQGKDEGGKQACSASGATKASKAARKKNIRQSCRPSNFNTAMALPNVMGAGCRMLPLSGFAGGMNPCAFGAQHPNAHGLMINLGGDLGSRQAAYGAMGGQIGSIAASSFGSLPMLQGQSLERAAHGQMDGLLDSNPAAVPHMGSNVAMHLVPNIASSWASTVPTSGYLQGMCAASNINHPDCSIHSWPVSSFAEHLQPMLAASPMQSAAPDTARMASWLLQQQRQAALDGFTAAQDAYTASDPGSYRCTTQQDLQQMLAKLTTNNYINSNNATGFNVLGTAGDVGAAETTTATVMGATSGGVNYHAAQFSQTEKQALRSSSSPVHTGGGPINNLAFNHGMFGAPNAAQPAVAGSPMLLSNARVSALPQITARTSDTSSIFGLCGPDISPMTAASSATPTYFQQVSVASRGLSSLNPGITPPATFNCLTAGAAGVAAQSSNCVVQCVLPAQADMSSAGSVSNFLTADHRWGSI